MAVVQSPGSSQVSMVMVAGEPFTAGKAEVWVSSALYHSPQNFVLMTLPRLHLNPPFSPIFIELRSTIH